MPNYTEEYGVLDHYRICNDCGAVVFNTKDHDNFHYEVDTLWEKYDQRD